MKESEIKSLKSSLNKANEKIVSLQGDVEAYRLSGEQMGKEIASLKCQNGGLKASNANYRKQVAELKSKVEHYKALCKEGDELYEQALGGNEDKLRAFKAEFEKLTKKSAAMETRIKELEEKVANKDSFIEGLQQKVSEQKVEIVKKDGIIASKDEIIKECDETIEEMRKPWWKKIF